MSKKHSDPYSPVRDVIRQLASLTHDELRDLADMLKADAATDFRDYPPRHGIPPVDPEQRHPLILRGGWQYRDDPPRYTGAARRELQQAYTSARDLPEEAAALVADVARQLQRTLAPVAERRISPDGTPLAEGNIEAKTIHRKVIDPDTGEVEIRAFGPYLYYRYTTSGGGSDRRDRRLKNKYIGRQMLAERFDTTEPGSQQRRDMERQIIAAFKAGTLDALMLEMGLQPESRAPANASELGDTGILPNSEQSEPDDTPQPAEPPRRGIAPEAVPGGEQTLLPGQSVRINLPGDLYHEFVGRIIAPEQSGKQIRDGRAWVEFVDAGVTVDYPVEALEAHDSVQSATSEAALPFLPDYQTAPTRKQLPLRFELTDARREVLAAIAAGLTYAADYRDGIQKRKIARGLAEAGLLAEVTGRTDHRKHAWRLTEAGLKLIRMDEDLQRRVSYWLRE